MTRSTITRKTHGAIAAVAGGALLLGTGATFAIWTAEETVSGGRIIGGSLALTADEGLTWQYSLDGREWPDVDEDYRMIPGHTVRGTAELTPELVGSGLTATLTLAGGDVISSFSGANVIWTLDGVEQVGAAGVTDLVIPAFAPGDGPVVLGVEIELPRPASEEIDNSDNAAFTNETLDRAAGTAAAWSVDDIVVTLTQD